jgi:hypothetical protein
MTHISFLKFFQFSLKKINLPQIIDFADLCVTPIAIGGTSMFFAPLREIAKDVKTN